MDAEKLERDHAAVRARRYLKLSNRNGGVQVDGFLDSVAGETVRAALDAAMSRPAAEDTRSSGNRRADALTAIAGHVLDDGAFKAGGQVRPYVMVTMSAAEWADWQRAGHAPSQAPGATIGDDVPLAPSEIDTLLCDCRIMRAVLDTDGQPVDLGRDKRTFTGQQRKALVLRDGHCVWPGCGMPAEYSEGHHVDEWALGGRTDIDKGALICTYHHHFVHAHNIVITPIQGGFRFAHPDGHVIGEHYFQRHDRPPAWAVWDKCAPEPRPPGRAPDSPPQLPLE